MIPDSFKIDARRIAEMRWGKGGTIASNTNRRGAYYYSCSSHGGYVVDSRCLTEEEKKRIEPYLTQFSKPRPIYVFVQHTNGGDRVLSASYTDFGTGIASARSVSVDKSKGPVEWIELPVYLFEEDCDWSLLEKMTDIRTDDYMMPSPIEPGKYVKATKEYHDQRIEESFRSCHAKKVKEATA